jgi:hypothetical protein
MMASPGCSVALPPSGTYSVSFWFFALPAWIICFLFSGFSFGKIYAKRGGANHNKKQETRKANVTKCQIFKTERL